MIALNTYSFGLGLGLAKGSKKTMNFKDFINFSKKNNIQILEFPIDYFLNKENQTIEYYLNLIKKAKFETIIDLEALNPKIIKKLSKLSEKYDLKIIRIKMSNFFGGNRHLIKNFYQTKIKFINELKKSIKIIKDSNLKFAIENHQDLNSEEIIDIIKKTSHTKVGINWDIANSLATIETPEEFFKNAKKYIINVHSKDYKIVKSNDGFYLKRCIIGQGVVDFKKFVNFFKTHNINFSIELGAHISRHCNFKNKQFIRSHKLSKNKIKKFEKYLKVKSIDENPFTDWELYGNSKKSYKTEVNDVKASINFVKELYAKK
jgi:L-ribulose-5-phosphate 3-epimerase UlaE